ncbi:MULTISPECIES: hypothetical protein [Deefgea]|uniref:Uncharacterized protein n=1 Tax=Deefgea chitinilytica TaxID=570276 RepID=A0ABS2C8E4_9NEIS|nr:MULTISPECIES: hypothetical protein [Deefgea]MBM5570416.1 hypothetical protein [Deefgea chitinilytica]MBM9887645.1 hypothetical protein [Deefgea sp. CFH1-16]
MKYQLTAPSYLLPTIAARLALNAPALQYSLCTPQMGNTSPDLPQLIFQADFFHPVRTANTIVDVFVIPSSLATLQGFMLSAGGTQEHLAAVSPILDALAPIPSGWLHAGEYGSAGFLHQIWNTLVGSHSQAWLPLWENLQSPNPSFQINHPDLVNQLSSFMAQQQLLTQSLASSAQRFLAEYPEHAFTPYHPQQPSLLSRQAPSKQSPAHEIATLLCSFKI